MKKQTLILDCDGVLYPISQLATADIVSAMKETLDSLSVAPQVVEEVSAQTKGSGMFNYIHQLCKVAKVDFADFCTSMQSKIDYSKNTRYESLLKKINQTKKDYDVVILTNNHQAHLNQVLELRFGKNINNLGIPCYSIEDLEKSGKFYPKQSQLGLKIFCNKLGKHPSECVLVDDTQRNLDSASSIGMQGVLITENLSLSKYLNQLKNAQNTSGKQAKKKSR